MNEPKRISAFWLSFIAIVAMGMAFQARASGDDIEQNTDVTSIVKGGDNMVDGSSHVSGSRSLALSNGMGDVDIAGCLGSTQWGTPVYSRQKLVLNQVCMAEFYLNNGLYDLAAMSLCNVPEILKEFSSEDECEARHNFQPVFHVEPSAMVEAVEDKEHEEYEQQFAMFQQQIEELSKQVNKPRVTRQVVQQPFLSEEKKALLREVTK